MTRQAILPLVGLHFFSKDSKTTNLIWKADFVPGWSSAGNPAYAALLETERGKADSVLGKERKTKGLFFCERQPSLHTIRYKNTGGAMDEGAGV